MSSTTLADKPQAPPTLERAPPHDETLHDVILPVADSLAGNSAAWERLLLAEDDLADAPPIPLDMMRRESLYGD